MPNFLGDLSEGIFERLGGLRREQESKDEQQKLETLRLLTGLTDQIEPESKPLLMRHIGDVIGMRGKMKGFWNAFSGMPDRSIEDQLGTQLKDISQGMVGSETAKKAREGGDLARLFQPMNPTQEANRNKRLEAEQGLQGKMIFRDPRAERLNELEQRYGLQNEFNVAKLGLTQDFQRRQQEDRQAHDKAMIEERANSKAQGDVLKRAYSKAAQRGFREPNTALMAEAADEIATEQGLNRDLLRARIGLAGAQTQQAQANAGYLKESGGLKPSDVMAEKRFDQGQFNTARTLHSEFTKAREQARTFITNNAAKEKALNQTVGMQGGKFDPATRSFIMEDPTLKPSNKAMGMLNDYLKDLEKEGEAKSIMKSRYQQLKQMPDYAEVGPDEWGDINIKEGIAPAGAKRAGGKQAIPPQKPSRPGPKAGLSTSKGQMSIPVIDPMKYEVGGRIKFRGRWHKITGLGVNSVMAIPE
jgi:hypothetical protein